MARVAKALGALAVSKITEVGYKPVGTVAGLYLQVSPNKARSWILRTMVGAKRRESGLGIYPAVTLQMAHQAARDKFALVRAGVDPVDAARAARSAITAMQAKAFTFKDCAQAYIAAHEASWRNVNHGQQWRNTLGTYAYPVMGQMLVRDVDTSHVVRVPHLLEGIRAGFRNLRTTRE